MKKKSSNNIGNEVWRASEQKFKFEKNMGSITLGVKRSIRVIPSSGKSASGTRPATK